MDKYESDIIQIFNVVINYYSDMENYEKANTYTELQKEYFEKIKAFEILPGLEQGRVKNIEELILSEMTYIKEIENNDKQ